MMCLSFVMSGLFESVDPFFGKLYSEGFFADAGAKPLL